MLVVSTKNLLVPPAFITSNAEDLSEAEVYEEEGDDEEEVEEST